MNPRFDDQDSAILAERVARWNARQGPRVGDWVELPDGNGKVKLKRFTHDHGDYGLQTTWDGGSQSFHFTRAGHMDYSGGLDPAIKKDRLTQIGEAPAPVWFFHHDHARAHNGVYVDVMCRVYRYEPEEGKA